MDKFRSLKFAHAIAKHGSLTAAARRLNVSAPTVVRVLMGLEEELGFSLFKRTTRSVTPTPEGEHYLARSRELLGALERMEAELRGDAENPTGPVAITAPVMFGRSHVAPALLRLREAYPGLAIRLVLADWIVKLSEETIDMAVRIGPLEDSALRAVRVGEVRQVLCASPDLIAQVGVPNSSADLEQLPCIAVDGNTGGRSWPFRDRRGNKTHVRIEPSFACNLVEPAIEACLQGHGFSLFLDYQVAEEIASGQLISLLSEEQPFALPVNVVRRHEIAPTSRTKLAFEALTENLRRSLSQ